MTPGQPLWQSAVEVVGLRVIGSAAKTLFYTIAALWFSIDLPKGALTLYFFLGLGFSLVWGFAGRRVFNWLQLNWFSKFTRAERAATL